jgi:16S rRNA (guanine527-N7)-methyltransferase
MEGFKEELAREFAAVGALSSEQLALLETHYELLLRWNRILNLTRITELTEAVQLHYCESLYVAHFLPKQSLKIADVGSGGGFPGVPIAILRPDCTIDLIESHQRKSVFLAEAVRRLGLTNVGVIAKRAEEVRGAYDWVVSRAVNTEEIRSLQLAPSIALLGVTGEPLPWGQNRALFHVKR